MLKYSEMNKEQLRSELEAIKQRYEDFCRRGLKLDMSRGKPCKEQLDLSLELLNMVNSENGYKDSYGTDCRNYGLVDGLPELKALFAEILEVPAENVIVGGNSSLNLMFDTVQQAMFKGLGGQPWSSQGKVKFVCPAPGYDRHFAICEYFGIEMITVQNKPNGPDIDTICKLIEGDPAIKGIWCVPKYENPEGFTYSDEAVKRLAAVKPAAPDFRIFWDNAYAVHDLNDEGDKLLNIYKECSKNGNEDMVIMFTSTSKITFAGAGVAAMAASSANISEIKKRLTIQTIGPDKINQLRHIRMFKNLDDIKAHMKRHAQIIKPKFETVLRIFDQELGDTGIAHWTKPNGGYFISLWVLSGCASRVTELCKQAGLVVTPAGATYPYGKDPDDSNIRIAPTFPDISELAAATELLCICVKYAALEKMI
ncbi:MAG TPA: aminotransferase class I/II-fold pyridoxal phosphate-dependent enzyme [Clostridiales bacterium]|nr:aminotransferase class I/II-fold pyridoxal phosphate-dependent enzyme [Clostridiales bacterium]